MDSTIWIVLSGTSTQNGLKNWLQWSTSIPDDGKQVVSGCLVENHEMNGAPTCNVLHVCKEPVGPRGMTKAPQAVSGDASRQGLEESL